VEKAGIDEVFLDLSRQIHASLLTSYPELSLPAPYDDPKESLPLPPTTSLDWQADALVDLDSHETEEDEPDWDDIVLLVGSEIVRGVRAAVRSKLRYTCSAGIAKNKMLAKLGSAHKKPNSQTVVRNRAVSHFLADYKFTKIRNLGGKLGDDMVDTFHTDTVLGLLDVSLERLKAKLGDGTGAWLYQVIRGVDTSEVNARTAIKSMLSAKSFRPGIHEAQAQRWLRIFCADIFNRLVEEGIQDNKRRPKTIHLSHRQGAQTRGRQAQIPPGRAVTKDLLFGLAQSLLGQSAAEGMWPCANLSLSVGGLEDRQTDNMGIGGFLLKGGHVAGALKGGHVAGALKGGHVAGALNGGDAAKGTDVAAKGTDDVGPKRGTKDVKADQRARENGLARYLIKMDSSRGDADEQDDEQDDEQPDAINAVDETRGCARCAQPFSSPSALASHRDWHFAKDLQDSERAAAAAAAAAAANTKRGAPEAPHPPRRARRGQKADRANAPEKGQTRLSFG
jgi:DNA polymerase eta